MRLFVLSALVCFLSCSSFVGTPMRGAENCSNLPTVEECQFYADRIEDPCLRGCVLHQCRVGRSVCDDATIKKCSLRSSQMVESQLGGYVPDEDDPHTCKEPKQEFNWCELDQSSQCRALIVVHELCHACGWHHGDGQGVPGDDGRVLCM